MTPAKETPRKDRPLATEPETASRRDLILASAANLFGERGFDGVNVHAIGAAAGVTGPAIYRHFANKGAVLVALYQRLAETLTAELEDLDREARSPHSVLNALVRFQVTLALQERSFIRVYLQEEGNLPSEERHEARRSQRNYTERWVKVLAQIQPDVPVEVLRTLVHAAIGLIISIGYYDSELPKPVLEDVLARAALNALLFPTPAADLGEMSAER